MTRRVGMRAVFLIPPSSDVEELKLNIIAFSLHVYTYSEFKVYSKKLEYELACMKYCFIFQNMDDYVGIAG